MTNSEREFATKFGDPKKPKRLNSPKLNIG